MNGDKTKVVELFSAALELSPGPERDEFLQEACESDEELHRKVRALLAAFTEGEITKDKEKLLTPSVDLPETLLAAFRQTEGLGTVIGRYKLLEQIGEGGMGTVWMADQIEPVQRRVAFKVIKHGMDSDQVLARFEAERQALALMDHANIAKVFDAGATDTGRPYFVMELVKGIPITTFCDEKQLSLRERLELFIPVCQAIQHAHQKGVIHRDIKPSNVLVALYDGKPVAKVIDFGIAKATGQRLTQRTLFTERGVLIGTLQYMSPEQAELNQLDIDTRSDIYSLGVLLYELLTGTTPLTQEILHQAAFDEILRRIREDEPPKPSTRLTDSKERLDAISAQRNLQPVQLTKLVRGDLDWIVMKCLEKDRTHRYETANGLASDVQRHLSNEPVMAGPPSNLYRFQKLVQRNKLAVAAVTAVAAVLVVGIIVATRARNNEAKANQQLRQQVSETGKARQAESQQRLRVEDALQRMQIQKAEELLAGGQPSLGIAYLGQVLRTNPSNYVASARLVSALVYRRFTVSLTEPIRHEGTVLSAQFSPDGQRVVTASWHKTGRVWDAHTGQAITEPLHHEVISAEFSPDGQRVVTASYDKTARVWDARTGQPLTDPLRHEGEVISAQFSPDGRRVVTASSDTTARVWDARTGQPLTEPLRHEGAVYSAQFSPDGQRVVTASDDKTARVWDARTGQPLTEPLRHEGNVRSAEFSTDGRRLVTASWDKTARVWDARTGQPLTDPLRHEGEVSYAQFSPDGQRVVTASWDKTARVWDARTGQPLTQSLRHEGKVSSAQFSPDGLRVVTASLDKTARVWDARTGQPLSDPLRHEGEVSSAQFSPDGQRVVTASMDSTARLWDVRMRQPLTDPLRHGGRVYSAQFSPDGRRVLTASAGDGMARVWDARTCQLLTDPLRHRGQVVSAQFSPDGQRVVTASLDKSARVWDARTGQPITDPLRHEGEVYSAQFSPDGLRVVTASEDTTALVWDARTGQPLTDPLRHEGEVYSAQFSPDGQRLVTASEDKTARVWDARTGQPLTDPLRHEGKVYSAQFSPDGQRVVTASLDKTARVWDARTGQPLTESLRHEDGVNSAQFSPDGLGVVTASSDTTARVWDARTGQPLTEPLHHEIPVRSAQFSPDSLRVVTATDTAARVWDVRTGQPLTEPLRHEAAVTCARFSPDGERVVTASLDWTARVWDLCTVAVPAPMWFLDWTEAEAGRSVSPQGTIAAVSLLEVRQRREQVANRADTNFFTRIAKWVLEDARTRSISPNSLVTVPEYLNHRIQENTIASLSEAIGLSPTNAVAFARLAVLLKDDTIASLREAIELSPTNVVAFVRLGVLLKDQDPGHLEEAEFYARYALKHDTDSKEGWRALGTIQLRNGQQTEALESIDRALELEPNSAQTWGIKGEILEKSNQLSEALAAYSRRIELLSITNGQFAAERSRTLLNRANVLRQLGRVDEAIEDNRLAYGIPTREAQADPNLIDLSAFYNAGFKGTWHWGQADNDLSELPTGIQKLAGTAFDVRGLVQLCFKNWVSRFPEQVAGLPVARKGRRIHFLHSVVRGYGRAGTVIGKYVIHYSDGAAQERPLVLGQDFLDWFAKPPEPTAGQTPTVAWSGNNAQSRVQGQTIQLYKTTWENPRPDAEIVSIDFVSANQTAAPFLVAITVE